jgi:3',5'-cyclic-AMP phosphodiesterase
MSDEPIRIVQITDTHVLADREGTLLGVKTQKSFDAVLELIKQKEEKIDYILHTGDITQDSKPDSYIRVAQSLNQLNLPAYCVPGNHDDAEMMRKIYPQGHTRYESQLIHDNWQIILLNTQKSKMVAGYLKEKELALLENCLKQYPHHHTAIVFHHHPMMVHSEWLDNLGLKNAEAFWEIVMRYSQINAIFFGHIHQEFSQLVHGIKFKPYQANFLLDHVPPGYRWIDLYPDGSIQTGVNRIATYVGEFQKDAKGY